MLVTLITIPEAARRVNACSLTLKRKIIRAHTLPDFVMVEGRYPVRTPLFLETRLGELKTLLNHTDK